MKKLLVLLLAGVSTIAHATDIRILTNPEGATIRIVNIENTRMKREPATYTGPVTIDFSRQTDPYQLQVSAPDHESAFVSVDTRNPRSPLRVELAPLVKIERFQVESEPTGAEVKLDGRAVGNAPIAVNVRFTRRAGNESWDEHRLTWDAPGYESRQATLRMSDVGKTFEVELAKLVEKRVFSVASVSDQGRPIEKAMIEIDGEVVGETPMNVPLVFERPNSSAPWSTFKLRVFIPEEFIPVEQVVSVTSRNSIAVELAPVTEVAVKRYFPTVARTARGPRQLIDDSTRVGILSTRDLNSPAVDLRSVTGFGRNEPTLQVVNSFTVTPDGQSLIYAVTMKADGDRFYSNLFTKSAMAQASPVTQLTRGSRFLDTSPTMCWEEGSNLVVFQSNRGPMDSWDVSSLRLQGGRVVGGIQQLTRDNRFNFAPTFIAEAQPIYFTSMEDYPEAEARISFVRPDGSALTYLGETGRELNASQTGLLYFTRIAEDIKKDQIYSITADGLSFSSLFNDAQFAVSNTHSPAISTDGTKLLFVSDYHTDEQGRQNNNVYLLELGTGRAPLQLTDNGSDDIYPAWSPTEPNTIYFLSNRGGVYNVWKMVFTVAN